MAPLQDSEPPMVSASRWVSQITNIALQMALPAGLGAWLDARWGTSPWLVVFGAGLGLFTAGTDYSPLGTSAAIGTVRGAPVSDHFFMGSS